MHLKKKKQSKVLGSCEIIASKETRGGFSTILGQGSWRQLLIQGKRDWTIHEGPGSEG